MHMDSCYGAETSPQTPQPRKKNAKKMTVCYSIESPRRRFVIHAYAVSFQIVLERMCPPKASTQIGGIRRTETPRALLYDEASSQTLCPKL